MTTTPKKFALVDLEIEGKKANREHTGGFGSFMRAEGGFGTLVSRLKSRLINLPVMAIAYSNALLRQAGHKSTFHTGGNIQDVDVIIIISSMHCFADEVAFAAQARAGNPRARIGFYGPFAQTRPEHFPNADFIIGGELETAILAYLEGAHDFTGTLNFGVVKDLADLPMPDWEGMPVETFSYFPMLHRRPFLPMQATRGCSFNCDFCPYMVSQTKLFRRRPHERVVDEMERNIKKYGMRSFLFRDICFTLNKAHAADIANEMIARSLDLEWGCETRIDCLTTELVDLLVAAGLRGVNIGIESPNAEILAGAGKKNPQIAFQETMIKYLIDKGVRINAFFMLGLPGDTPQTMAATIDYAVQLNTQGAQFCVTTPFPGTPLYEKEKYNLLTDDFTTFDEYRPVMNIVTSTAAEVTQAHASAFRKFYLRPSWMARYGFSTAIRLLVNLLPRPAAARHSPQ